MDFGDPLSDRLDVTVGREPHVFGPDELDTLARWTRTNLAAMSGSATPTFYCFEVTDGLAAGAALQVDPGTGAAPIAHSVDAFPDDASGGGRTGWPI